jgi:hypothetical protein
MIDLYFFSAHKFLCRERSTLHRDISLNNIILYHDPNSQSNHCKGLLIDYDYAKELDQEEECSSGYHTVLYFLMSWNAWNSNWWCLFSQLQGTGPFMALEVLNHADEGLIRQKPKHDLESVFYVLLYICLRYDGPRGKMVDKNRQGQRSNPTICWFRPFLRFLDLGDMKRGQLLDIEARFSINSLRTLKASETAWTVCGIQFTLNQEILVPKTSIKAKQHTMQYCMYSDLL